MGCTVAELLDRISAEELIEWSEYMKIRAWEEQHGRSATALYRPGVPAE